MAVATAHLCSGGRKAEVLTNVLGCSTQNKSRLRSGLEDVYRATRRGDTMMEFLKTREWLLAGVSPHIVQSVPAAFAMFIYSEDFENAVKNAVKLGGDH